MEYVFLFAIVAPLALLVLNLTGFRAGSTPAALAFEAPAPAAPAPVVTTPAPVAEPVAQSPSETRGISTSFASVISRNKRHRRDFFGDYSNATSAAALDAPVNEGAEIFLMPRRDDAAPVAVSPALPAAHARPGGNLVSFPSHTPLVAQRSVAQR